MGFKLGDKVRLINYFEEGLNGSIGRITEVRNSRWRFPYKVDFDTFWLPVNTCEIEPALKIGEQLLLFEL